MPTTDDTIATYGAAWREPDPGKRNELLKLCVAENVRYVDPTANINGRTELMSHIGRVLETSGGNVELTSSVNTHHDVAHFTWRMVGPDGAIMVTGHDFALFDGDGQIELLSGFFGDPAPR